MIANVEAGNVVAIIVKDMSRFGRDYLKVGFYTEIMFKEKGVRFIAINNGIDSADQQGNDFIPFLNIMNEWYARDCSRKIQAIFKARMQEGKRVSPSVPYGYLRSSEDKQKLIIDERAASVVRRIFQLVLDGKGVSEISNILCEDKVLIPSAYAEKYCPENQHSKSFHNPYRWTSTSVSYILEKKEYLGHTILGKTISESYKTKKRRKATDEELMIFENTHATIIQEETWNNVQRLLKTKRKPKKNGKPPCRLSGLLFCADCGSKLSHRFNSRNLYEADNAYVCSGYRQHTRNCTMHYIRVSVVEDLILSTIQLVSNYALENEMDFMQIVREASEVKQELAMKELKLRLNKAQQRHDDIDDLIKKLYESYATGKIPEKNFERLLAGYDTEQMALETEVKELQAGIDSYNSDSVRADKFIQLVKRYSDFSELTTPMLNEFVEKMVVYEAKKNNGFRRQKVEIYLNFIGAFEVPGTVLSEVEQMAEEEKILLERKERKRTQQRERQRAKSTATKKERDDFQARKKAHLLTLEELEKENNRLEKRRVWFREYRQKKRNLAVTTNQ